MAKNRRQAPGEPPRPNLEKMAAALEETKGTRAKHAPASESRINKQAQDALNSLYLCSCEKYHGTVFGRVGHSDLYGVYQGRAFYIEGKRGVRERHDIRLSQINFLESKRLCGAIVGIYTSAEEAVQIVASYGEYDGGFALIRDRNRRKAE